MASNNFSSNSSEVWTHHKLSEITNKYGREELHVLYRSGCHEFPSHLWGLLCLLSSHFDKTLHYWRLSWFGSQFWICFLEFWLSFGGGEHNGSCFVNDVQCIFGIRLCWPSWTLCCRVLAELIYNDSKSGLGKPAIMSLVQQLI